LWIVSHATSASLGNLFLKVAIREIREALGDDAETPRFIEGDDKQVN
jgi:hypothetical protein